MSKPFEEINGNFGFGMMRLPMLDDKTVDVAKVSEMADAFIDAGFNYFDTAHGYLDGLSELAVKAAISSRYDRAQYLLTDKLTADYFDSKESARAFFMSQLEACGVDYFDFYLIHSVNRWNYDKFRDCGCFELVRELKAEGLIRHAGLSFHDTAEMLDSIITDYPWLECIQLQVNYLDYNSEAIQSGRCVEVCCKHEKPIIVMEPIKGGMLARLPEKAKYIVDKRTNKTPAELALRFAAGCDNVYMTLSGMNSVKDMHENITVMKDCRKLNDEEISIVEDVLAVFNEMSMIQCTGCRYCVAGCPMNIDIPALFSCMNIHSIEKGWNSEYYYERSIAGKGKARDCIGCGSCEESCPQHLPIREHLKTVAQIFKKQEEDSE
ncbi:MAG: 4Fe-4S dicluster domain-containing protein [Clostridiales bacterium]|jgi:predicted aldo/keto reductase-like oxidoreductase|nr:4Fe-4S dicluster domain-containing protein [Clostridiales bacterium]